jgi:hypothetical protein
MKKEKYKDQFSLGNKFITNNNISHISKNGFRSNECWGAVTENHNKDMCKELIFEMGDIDSGVNYSLVTQRERNHTRLRPKPRETNKQRLYQREKQISYGKATVGYKNYIQKVSKFASIIILYIFFYFFFYIQYSCNIFVFLCLHSLTISTTLQFTIEKREHAVTRGHPINIKCVRNAIGMHNYRGGDEHYIAMINPLN